MNKLLYISLLIFFVLLLSVNQGVGVVHLDEHIRLGVQNLWGESLNFLVIAVTDFGAELSVIISLLFVIAYFSWRKQAIFIRYYITGLFGGILLFEVLKEIVGRARPDSMMIFEPALSFPSGHATIASILAWFVYFAFSPLLRSPLKQILIGFCIFYPLLMSFTRVYLNVHYLSDVLAGISLGTCWMIFLSKFYLKNETQIPLA